MVELTYRSMCADDFDALHRIMSDWSVVRQLGGWPWPADPAHTSSRCVPYDGDGFVWAICRNGQLIGSIGVTGGDLGYALDPAFHGQGIMSRAAAKAVSTAFATTDRAVLSGSAWFDNAAPYALLRGLGFQHWQTRYMHAKARNRPTLVNHLRLTRTRWERLSSTAQ